MSTDQIKFVEPYVRVGVAVVVRKHGKILMGLRKGSHGAGTWGLPGGHMELGEHPAVTALRELGEELGSTCVFGELTILKSFPYISTVFEEGKHHITLFFETVLKSGQPRVVEPDKCDRWEWFEPDNLPSPLFGNLAIVDFR